MQSMNITELAFAYSFFFLNRGKCVVIKFVYTSVPLILSHRMKNIILTPETIQTIDIMINRFFFSHRQDEVNKSIMQDIPSILMCKIKLDHTIKKKSPALDGTLCSLLQPTSGYFRSSIFFIEMNSAA